MEAPDWVALGSFHPSYARVYGWAIDEPYGFALIDTNDDGREIAFELFEYEDSDWKLIDSRDDVGGGSWASWTNPNVVWAYGHSSPGSTVLVEHNGAPHSVTANDTGWWAFIRRVETAGEEHVPRLV